MLPRLKTELLNNDVLPPEQFGFQSKLDTTLQLTRLIDHITSNFNNQLVTIATFLDVEKAFDKAWHNGILYKMIAHNMNLDLIKFIQSFLADRSFTVARYGRQSTIKFMEAGVPQGSVLAPLLYNILICDTPAEPGTYKALYADDTCLFATERNPSQALIKMQKSLDSIESWSNRWNIKINPEKNKGHTLHQRTQDN